MKNMTLRRIAEECSGILHTGKGMEAAAAAPVEGITTDSRAVREGFLFAALKGERVDGHDYIGQAYDKGAVCALTEKDLPEVTDKCWIRVRSVMEALALIARAYRRELGIPVVGIAGSVGKTSTKEMVASVLSQKYRTLKTQGNLNNELGVPLTIFSITEEHEMAVVEMGINHFGEMHRLANMVRPDICVMTNIGECHLEYLIDRDGVLRAKTEIFDFLKPDGHIVLNGNDDKLVTVKPVNGVEPVFFGLKDNMPENAAAEGAELSYWADNIGEPGLDGTFCTIHTPQGSFDVTVPIPGMHYLMNALSGTAVGCICGLTLDEIRRGIENVQPVGGRFRIIRGGRYTLIDDCYNANPVSMRSSLHVLGYAKGRRVAVLGDMAELGPDEIRFHEQIGEFAAETKPDLLVGIGERSRALVEAARRTDPELKAVHFDDAEDFIEESGKLLKEGDIVLIKASHCMEFSKIVEALS